MSAPLHGPWMHGSPSEFGTFHVNTIYDADGVSVAQIYELPNNTTIEDTDPNRWGPGLARARLIAAAPELLGQHEADMVDLGLLAKAIHAGDPMPELVIRVTDMLNRKRAVIAKATTP